MEKTYIIVIENAPKREITRCMYEACYGVGNVAELTSHSFLFHANTDIALLRNLFACSLGPKAKIFITESTGTAAWTGNLRDTSNRICRMINGEIPSLR